MEGLAMGGDLMCHVLRQLVGRGRDAAVVGLQPAGWMDFTVHGTDPAPVIPPLTRAAFTPY